MRDLLAIGLRLADQRLEPGYQVLCGCSVKSMIDLAGVEQLAAFMPAQIDAVEFLAVEREPRDRQRLSLRTGFFHPLVRATRIVTAVPDLGDDAFKASLAGVLVHLPSVPLET